jgi:ubiquinone/menaquinone biosynthesis C-methylase UbiE
LEFVSNYDSSADMMTSAKSETVQRERQRILAEYERRERSVSPELYAPWQPANQLLLAERRRVAAKMLHEAGAFPKPGDQCLEIGCGSLGWLGELISWGVRETYLHAIELDRTRAEQAQAALPAAEIVIGDAAELPWPAEEFKLVVVSTVFSSILDNNVRRLVADEIMRVLAPGGALLWYDFAANNPSNSNVRKVSRRELVELFPRLKGKIRRVTLAPPLARWIAPRSWTMATLLQAAPFLRTHRLAVLLKVA